MAILINNKHFINIVIRINFWTHFRVRTKLKVNYRSNSKERIIVRNFNESKM